MRVVYRAFYKELHPESAREYEHLKALFPHAAAFDYVCVSLPTKPALSLQRQVSYGGGNGAR